MGDDVTRKIKDEVNELQGALKEELKSQRDLGDIEANLKSEAFTLEKTTEEHVTTSEETRNRMFWKNFKYYLLAGVVIGLLLLAIFGPLLR